MEIVEIDHEDTYELRHRVMNPEQSRDEMHRQGDEEATHFAAVDNTTIRGVISFYPQDQEGNQTTSVWRIRGMAVDTGLQRQGIGKQLFVTGLDRLSQLYEITTVWCNSRENAVKFYEHLGFDVTDTTYVTEPSPGTRYRMVYIV